LKKPIGITEVTRMQEGRVCIAGYDQHGQAVRPVLPPPGIHESTLYSGPRPLIFPSAKVEFEFVQPTPQPPHTEDIRYDPVSVHFVERQPAERWHKMLEKTLSRNVSDIFEQPIHSEHGHYIMDGQGPRSLGTITPARITQVIHELSPENKWQYRLRFEDGADAAFRLTVTDLAWRYYCDYQRAQGEAPPEVAAALLRILQTREVYLRVGLARGWDKFPGRCYIQLTGIHTFPDYLSGKTFADFAPHKSE
jgi:hypothetical protein